MNNKPIPNYIDRLSKNDLIHYLKGLVDSIESESDKIIEPDVCDFIDLQSKIISELSLQRIYKVSNVDMSDFESSGIKEYHIQYFGSLRGAKRELKKRFREQRSHPFVAAPDEIQDIGLTGGIKPLLLQSVVGNRDVTTLRAPGRYKFYEIRMLQENQIVPVQFMLTSIDATPAQSSRTKSKNKIEFSDSPCFPINTDKGLIIPFSSIKRGF